MTKISVRSRLDVKLLEGLEELRVQTGALGVWYRSLRRVQGVVHYAGTRTVGPEDVMRPFADRDGQPVAADYQHATIEQVPAWNTWVDRPMQGRTHLRCLVVAPNGSLHGIVDLVPSDTPAEAHAASLPLDVHAFLPPLRPEPPPAREAVLYFAEGTLHSACRAGHLLWNKRTARHTITQLLQRHEPVARAFMGTTWLERTRTESGSLVWALPSSPVDAPPIGSLPEVARRVALGLIQGITVPEVAERLSRSRETVRTHSQQIRRRLAVTSRVEMAERLRSVHWQ